jgi:hypothetical protein
LGDLDDWREDGHASFRAVLVALEPLIRDELVRLPPPPPVPVIVPVVKPGPKIDIAVAASARQSSRVEAFNRRYAKA